LDLGHPVQPKLLEIASQRVDQAALVAVELRESSWILSGLRIVLDDVIDGTVEDHEPCGITRDDLRQNSCRRRYLIIPALVGYQTLKYLLPDALFVFGGNALFPAFLNSRKPMLEGILIAWRSTPTFDAAFAWNACHCLPRTVPDDFRSFYQNDFRLFSAKN